MRKRNSNLYITTFIDDFGAEVRGRLEIPSKDMEMTYSKFVKDPTKQNLELAERIVDHVLQTVYEMYEDERNS